MRAYHDPVTMKSPHKVHVNNLLTRDILMSFVTRTLLTSFKIHSYNELQISFCKNLPVKCYQVHI